MIECLELELKIANEENDNEKALLQKTIKTLESQLAYDKCLRCSGEVDQHADNVVKETETELIKKARENCRQQQMKIIEIQNNSSIILPKQNQLISPRQNQVKIVNDDRHKPEKRTVGSNNLVGSNNSPRSDRFKKLTRAVPYLPTIKEIPPANINPETDESQPLAIKNQDEGTSTLEPEIFLRNRSSQHYNKQMTHQPLWGDG